MGLSSSAQPKEAVAPVIPTEGETKKKLKPCCACPETRKVRDECIADKGQENCKDLIEAHLQCMRKEGFNV